MCFCWEGSLLTYVIMFGTGKLDHCFVFRGLAYPVQNLQGNGLNAVPPVCRAIPVEQHEVSKETTRDKSRHCDVA